MPGRFGEAIPAAVGTGGGIGGAAGREEDGGGFRLPAVGKAGAGDFAVLQEEFRDFAGDERNPRLFHLPHQRVADVGRLVRLGEDPGSPLGFEGDAGRLEKADGVLVVEAGEGRVEEAGVAGDVPHQFRRRDG